MKLSIEKDGKDFVVDNKDVSGSPKVGRGRTLMSAIGSWLHNNQDKMGIEFVLSPEVQKNETKRQSDARRRR